MGVPLSEIVEAVEAFAPLDLAEPWDNPGIQVGDPASIVDRIVISLDPTFAALNHAFQRNAQLLLTHHPVSLETFRSLDISTPTGNFMTQAVASGIAVYSAHTNLDRAKGGVNDVLASKLNLINIKPLIPSTGGHGLSVVIPVGHEACVEKVISTYLGASSSVSRFLGKLRRSNGELVCESGGDIVRYEIFGSRNRLLKAAKELVSIPPGNSVNVYLNSIEGKSISEGLGRVGNLRDPIRLADFAKNAMGILSAPGMRLIGDPESMVEVVAVCGGSGGSMWEAASDMGAQVYVTGDVRYHTALDAVVGDLAIVDLGHGPTESVAAESLKNCLLDWMEKVEIALDVEIFQPTDPFLFFSAEAA